MKPEFNHVKKNQLKLPSDLRLSSVKGDNHFTHIHTPTRPTHFSHYSQSTCCVPGTCVLGSRSDEHVR